MRKYEDSAKVLEHPAAIVSLSELDRGHCHQGSHVPAEALWRRIVELIRDGGHRESGILEEPRRAHESRRGQILLGRGKLSAEEAAHQRTGQNFEPASKTS